MANGYRFERFKQQFERASNVDELEQALGLRANVSNAPYKDAAAKEKAEEEERRRKEEEERRKRMEEEERERQERNASLEAALQDLSSTKYGDIDTDKLPDSKTIFNQEKAKTFAPFKEVDLENTMNIRNAVEAYKAQGLNDKEIGDKLIPAEDNSIEQRLAEIEKTLKPGKEGILQNLREGWQEKEVQNMYAQEMIREMNGLPNKAKDIENWLQKHPEISESEEGSNILSKGIRFLTEGTRQNLDSIIGASKDWRTWAIAGTLTIAGLMAAPYTAGLSVPASLKIVGSLAGLGAVKAGMTYGRIQQMADLETADKYREYINEGIQPDIAKEAAKTAGAFNGVIEFMQIDSAFKMIPGVTNLLENGSKLATKELVKGVTKVLANYGVNMASEALQEASQEGVGILGLEASKYLEDAPNPNTLDGLKTLAKTFDREDYRQRVIDSGSEALQSMWLAPIVSSGVRFTVGKGINSVANKIDENNIRQYSEADEKRNAEYVKQQKDVLLGNGGVIDYLVEDAKQNKNMKSVQAIVGYKDVLQDIAARDDTTNQDKERIREAIDKIDPVVSQMFYETKENNTDIEYQPTSRQEVEDMVTSPAFLNNGDIQTQGYNEYTIEQYNFAKEKGILDTVKEQLNRGTNKAAIADSIVKSLPRKNRSVLAAMRVINAVEKVQRETKAQTVLNELSNLQTLQDNIPSPNPLTEETEPIVQNNEQANQNEGREEGAKESITEQNQPAESVATEGTETLKQETNQTEGETAASQTEEPSTEETDENLIVEDITGAPETKIPENMAEKEEETPEYEPGNTVMVPVKKINVDPERFQFRYDALGESGTTSRLAGAEYNSALAGTILLWQDKNKDLYVVNGHHRVALAKANNVEEMQATIITEDEYTAEQARAYGAMLNIAENNATAIDVAKLMKDTKATEGDFKSYGISPNSKIAKDGAALANLNDWIFQQVATRAIPLERAVIIGREFAGDSANQNAVVRAISELEAKGKTITNSVLNEMIAQAKGTGQTTFTQQTLFGEETITKSLAVERAEVVSYVKSQLKARASVLKNVSKDRAISILTNLGNVLSVDENTKEMTKAEQASYILDKTLNYQGTKTNELFNRLAEEYANANQQERLQIKKRALAEFLRLMEGGNLFGEADKRGQRQSIQTSIQDLTEGKLSGLEGSTAEQTPTEEQISLLGEDNLNQLKKLDRVKVIINEGASDGLKKSTLPIIKAMQDNPVFNGLAVVYSGEESEKYFTREELDNAGYKNAEAGKYQIAGRFRRPGMGDRRNNIETDTGRGINGGGNENSQTYAGKIILNNGAGKDTLLHEVIHALQYRFKSINPELAAQITAWENDIETEARNKGIFIPEGKELLVRVLMHGEFGYAKDDPVGDLISIDDDIVSKIKDILGEDIITLSFGKDEAIPRKERLLQSQYKNYADRMILQKGFAETVEAAKTDRMSEMKQEVENGGTTKYYNPVNGRYAMVTRFRDGGYMVAYFDEEEGVISSNTFDNTEDVIQRLSNGNFFYKTDEIYYQLKKYNRTTTDDLYKKAIKRGYSPDKENKVSFTMTDDEIADAYYNARNGNLNAHDFDELIRENKALYPATKNSIADSIIVSIKKGLDIPNGELTFKQFLHRFYGFPWENGRKTTGIRINDDNMAEVYTIDRSAADLSPDSVPTTEVLSAHKTFEEAIEAYKKAVQYDSPDIGTLRKFFLYAIDEEGYGSTYGELKNQYDEFRDKVETYRNRGVSFNLEETPHYYLTYRLNKNAKLKTDAMKNLFGDTDVADVYDPETNYQLKPITQVEGFYSKLEQIINTKMGKRAKPTELMNMLLRNGAKPEELDWFEIGKFTEGKDWVYKNELLDHMREKPIVFTKENIGDRFSRFTLNNLGELPENNYQFNAYVYNHEGEAFEKPVHFKDLKNVIAHSRYTDKTGINGEKILFVEELQSDWHQQGRAEGYGKFVPDAPLKESVTDFLVKTAIKDAVEGGYDYVAWTTGEQQAERYNVGNYVSKITWNKNTGGTYSYTAYGMDGRLIANEEGKTLNDFANFAGQDMAKQLSTSTENSGEITGDNLRVGGEFYKKLYDRYIPRMVNKYVKKYGSQLTTVELPAAPSLGGQTYEDRLETYAEISAIEAENLVDINRSRIIDDLYTSPTTIGLTSGQIEDKAESIRSYIYDYGIADIEDELWKKALEYSEDGAYDTLYAIYDYGENDIRIINNSDGDFDGLVIDMVSTPFQLEGRDLIDENDALYKEWQVSGMDVQDFLKEAQENQRKTLTQQAFPITPKMIKNVMEEGQPLFQLKPANPRNDEVYELNNISEGELKSFINAEAVPMKAIKTGGTDNKEISLIFGRDAGFKKDNEVLKANEIQGALIDIADISPEKVEEIQNILKSKGIIVIEKYNSLIDGDRERARDEIIRPRKVKTSKSVALETNDTDTYYALKADPEKNERSWGQTVRDSSITEPWLKELLTDKKFYYDVKHNEDTLIAAAKLIETKGEPYVEARLLSDLENDTTLMAASQILTYKYMQDGEADRAMSLLEKTAEKATSAGQAIQILSVWGRQTPTGMLRKTVQQLNSTMTEKDKKQVNEDTKTLVDAMNRINKEAIDKMDIAAGLKEIKEMTPAEMLARRIANTLSDRKSRERDATQDMIDTLYRKAKETLPAETEKAPTDPLVFVVDAIKNREKYKKVWDEAKKELQERFADQPDKLALLQPYFDENADVTFAKSQLKKAISNELKDMEVNIRNVVKEHYSSIDKIRTGLADKFIEKGNLTGPEALLMEKYITDEMKERTEAAKESVLNQMFKKRKPYERKSLQDQIIEMSNLGALKNENYRHLVAEKLGLPTMTEELANYIQSQAERIQTMPEGRERDVETAKIMKAVADNMPVSMWKKVATVQTMSQLLNGKTILRNLIGNALFETLDTFTTNFIGAPIDAAFSKAYGNNRTTLFRPVTAFQEQKLGYKEGWRLGLEDALKGIDTSNIASKHEISNIRTFKGGVLGSLETALNITMRATDRAAYMATFRDAIEEQMRLERVELPTEEMIANAQALALYRTFNDKSALANMFINIKKGLNAIGSKNGEFGLGDFILKYPKTPANILSRAVDYSPAGLLTTIIKLHRDTSGSKYIHQRMAVEGLSRAIMGTGLISIGALLARMGIISGSNPDDDKDIYALKKQYGLKDFVINTSALGRHLMSGFKDSSAGELRAGDKLATYDWAQPLSMALAIGADTVLGSGKLLDALSALVRAAQAGMTTLTEQPLLTGLTTWFGSGSLAEGTQEILKGSASSFTPGLLAQVAQFIDGRDTDPYSFYGVGEQAWNLVANRIPGLRGTIPSRYTALGEERRYTPEDMNVVTKALNTFLTPSIMTQYMPDDEARFIIDAYHATGDADVVPKKPQKTYTIDGVTYTFNPQSWAEMSQWLGSEMKSQIGYAMDTYMQGMAPDEQAAEIEEIIKDVKKLAKDKVLQLGTRVD